MYKKRLRKALQPKRLVLIGFLEAIHNENMLITPASLHFLILYLQFFNNNMKTAQLILPVCISYRP